MYEQTIELLEWDNLFLEDTYFNRDESRLIAEELSNKRIIDIIELRQGLSIKTYSYVGRINIGEFQININPKINGLPLYQLLNYAYQLNDLKLFERSYHSISNFNFFDLIIYKLYLEATDLLYKGLQKQYLKKEEELVSPRGSIDVKSIASQGGLIREKLPCIYFYRNENNLLNQILLGGLRLGVKLASDSKLKIDVQNLCNRLDEGIEPVKLSRSSLQSAKNKINRLTKRYEPALEIINILYESQSIDLENNERKLSLKGYLFDMNSFFETLIGRLLKDFCSQYTIKDQYKLNDLFLYNPDFNPRNFKSPTPRPDFALISEGKLVKILDAKYKDLWGERIPSNMLYQLAIYAMNVDGNKEATIIYPSVSDTPSVQKIDIRNPISNSRLGEVILQPINLVEIAKMLTYDKRGLARYIEGLVLQKTNNKIGEIYGYKDKKSNCI